MKSTIYSIICVLCLLPGLVFGQTNFATQRQAVASAKSIIVPLQTDLDSKNVTMKCIILGQQVSPCPAIVPATYSEIKTQISIKKIEIEAESLRLNTLKQDLALFQVRLKQVPATTPTPTPTPGGPTPTPTPTRTPTPTPTPGGPTPTPTVTPTVTPTATPTATPTPGGSVDIPGKANWETNMTAFGTYHCTRAVTYGSGYGSGDCNVCATTPSSAWCDACLAATYYDAEKVYYNIADYVPVQRSYWNGCADIAEKVYRDYYTIRNNGALPGYWKFTNGLYEDYTRMGDQTSKTAINLIANNAAYNTDSTSADAVRTNDYSREVAYAIQDYINQEKVGGARRSNYNTFVDLAIEHVNQFCDYSPAQVKYLYLTVGSGSANYTAGEWVYQGTSLATATAKAQIISQFSWNQYERVLKINNVTGYFVPGTATKGSTSGTQYTTDHGPLTTPFMVGLSVRALIKHHEHNGYTDQRIIPVLVKAADHLWTLWLPSWKAFPYRSENWASDGTDKLPTPDLNQLIAPLYAYLWWQTGETRFRDRGDQLFEGGVATYSKNGPNVSDGWWQNYYPTKWTNPVSGAQIDIPIGGYLHGPKQYDQNYTWSFDYMTWRAARQ